MSFTSKRAPERVSRWTVWVFVLLFGAAGVASLGFPGGGQPPDATLTGPGAVETTLAHGVTMLAGLVESAWRETVRELSRVVIALLQWQWWPLDVAIQADMIQENMIQENRVNWQEVSGGANVLHS